MKIIKTSEALPKSGRYVLAWTDGAKIPMRAMWAAQHTLPLGDDADLEWGEYSEEKDEYFCPAGWYEVNQFEEQHWGVSGNVVAWCELPRLDHQCLAQIEEPAGAAPAAVAPQDVVAWVHPETLNVISAAHKHDMSTEYGAETRRKAESYSVALVRAGEPAAAAPALEAPAAPESAPWCPDVCPITGRPFFMWIEHHKTGQYAPTYGGPHDSYTLPVKGSDGSFECERYDHDRGGWLTDEIQDLGLMIVDDQSFIVAPDHPRYNEVEEFANGAATFAAAKPGSMIAVPFDLIASACSAIDKKRDAPKTLAELRRYTTGDLSCAALAAAPQAPAAPGAYSRGQHDADSRELRSLCIARDAARRERDLARVEIAGLQASTGHLSALVDGQHALLEKAKATMTDLHGSASPIDESGGDFDARIPASAFARFVDAHAELLHTMAQSPVAAPAAPAVDADPMAEFLRDTGPAIVWPKARDVGRIGDMSPSAHLRIGLDSDNDVYASIWDERGGATIEFCTPGSGGGKSSRTRMALLAVMVAMEADNAVDPRRDWWAERNGAAQAAAKGAAS